MSEKGRFGRRRMVGALGTFLLTLVCARLIVDLSLHGTLIRSESYVSVKEWVVPLGFALIGVFAYWYRTRTTDRR